MGVCTPRALPSGNWARHERAWVFAGRGWAWVCGGRGRFSVTRLGLLGWESMGLCGPATWEGRRARASGPGAERAGRRREGRLARG
eukprot:scaffold7816_cov1049-Prasinococcus_capsulatus_cf.AAC.1